MFTNLANQLGPWGPILRSHDMSIKIPLLYPLKNHPVPFPLCLRCEVAAPATALHGAAVAAHGAAVAAHGAATLHGAARTEVPGPACGPGGEGMVGKII